MILVVWEPLGTGAEDQETLDAKSSLEKSKLLFAEGRLDDAIELLVSIAREDPKQIQRVQDVILEIRKLKNQINTLFEQLNNAAIKGDEKTADQMIRAIKALDTNPNRDTLNNLILAAITISKALNDAIRDDIYERGNSRLTAGIYKGAVDIYRTGFTNTAYLEFYDEYIELAQDKAEIARYRDDPERQSKIWEAYGTIAPEGNRVIDDIDAALDNWDTEVTNLDNVVGTTVASLGLAKPGDWDRITRPFNEALKSTGETVDVVRNTALDLGDIQDELYAMLDGIPEDFRYERIGRFIFGRLDSEGLEGIQRAQEEQLFDAFTMVTGQMDREITDLLSIASQDYLDENWNTAISDYLVAASAAEEALAFSQKVERWFADRRNAGALAMADIIDSSAYRAYVAQAAPIWAELAELYGTLPDLSQINLAELELDEIDVLAEPALTALTRGEELKLEWDAAYSSLSGLPGAQEKRSKFIDSSIREDLLSAIEDFQAQRFELYVDAIAPLYVDLEERTRTALESDIEQAGELVGDPSSTRVTEDIPLHQPSVILDQKIIPELENLSGIERDLEDFLELLDGMLDRSSSADDPSDLEAYASAGEDLLLDAREALNKLQVLEENAQVQINAALRAQSSANNALEAARRDMAAAQAAVRRGQSSDDINEYYQATNFYDAVDESLDVVDSLYLKILVNDRDIAEASGIDDARSNLRKEAQSDRTRLSVTVKQNAVEVAQNAYEDRLYASGIGILSQAQEFWKQSRDEEDPELSAWLRRLQNALAYVQFSVIDPFDPLYNEMNQYLNLANRYFTEGIRIAQEDSRNTDAQLSFQAAGDLVEQVLSTFPGNKAALLLVQKILRQTDEATWSEEAQKTVNETRRAVSREDITALQGSGREEGLYSQVKVLEEIDPEYPGLAALIYDAEVVLGIVIPPPNPANLNESRRLTNEAKQLWENLGITGSGRALDLLDTALALWLDNQEASQLKNDILLLSEPQRLAVLPAELLNLLALVEQYYSENNFIVAQVILDRISTEYALFVTDPRVQSWKAKVGARQ